MNVHAFGGTSSPICSNYGLERTARDNEVKYDPEVAETLRSNFYVDDLLKSVKDGKIAVTLIKDVKTLCAEGGFHLTKLVSNSKHVLLSIPEEDRRKGIHDQELRPGTTKKALRIHWDLKEDKLGFCINFKEKPSIKRGMISMVSSICDPLGLVSRFLLEGRRIIQMLCYNQSAWDDPVDKDIQEKWVKWKYKLNILTDIRLSRCYKPEGFRQVVSSNLHHFSDASENGYGQVVYMRLVNAIGKIHCSLVIAKSRVPSVKYTSIPRLELAAAVLSKRMSVIIRKELQYQKIVECY